ncbi:hypothetical protein K1514_15045 [Paraclostridium bifermentans]|uniref:hypothetical protein n=1 Tax=Paraclostridium TaxID=1849822 RepID=UPI001CC7D0AA|nr:MULTISPECIES: hypothetical protein [Paraclostridium]MBZ6007208.1 hypothetical protein [Paraclostridium bifermentans]MDU0296896.1 hypothetical protein [Paraclostridium sp. MRS3W1]
MGSKKRVTLANFNCTYGLNDEPMLTYFEELILPAFNGGLKRFASNDTYFFDRVKLIEYKPEEYILTGILVKSTILEIKSRYYAESGLVDIDDKVKADPYSIFAIYLKNHRMILVQNQKGSPDIRNFRATIRETLEQTRNEINRKNKNKIPYVNLNIASIPSKYEIKKQLESVKSIQKLSLKFYPLNGDVDTSSTIKSLRSQLDSLGSKTGTLDYRSPKNIEGVGEFIENTKGTSDATLWTTFEDGTKRKMVNDEFSEKIEVKIDESAQYPDNILDVVDKLDDKEELKEYSEENKNIYIKALNKIKNIASLL